jgi:hypothetical protein
MFDMKIGQIKTKSKAESTRLITKQNTNFKKEK